MLNIGRLVATSFDYYLDKVARSQEEYYTGSGEAPGRWLGSQAARLGLAGQVPEEGLRRLLGGQHPASGAELADRAGARTVAGFDLTFRAPKSVSLLYALGGREVARTVVAAHNYALGQALGYLEREATWTRRATPATSASKAAACWPPATSTAPAAPETPCSTRMCWWPT